MGNSITLKRIYPGKVENIYQDFVNPEFVKRWFFEQDYWTAEAHADVRVGGHYDVTMVTDIGNTFTHDGEFEVIRPNELLKFTWGSGLVEQTHVTIEFNQFGENVEVKIEHRDFPNEKLMMRHKELWENCLRHLEEFIANPLPYEIYQDPDYYQNAA